MKDSREMVNEENQTTPIDVRDRCDFSDHQHLRGHGNRKLAKPQLADQNRILPQTLLVESGYEMDMYKRARVRRVVIKRQDLISPLV